MWWVLFLHTQQAYEDILILPTATYFHFTLPLTAGSNEEVGLVNMSNNGAYSLMLHVELKLFSLLKQYIYVLGPLLQLMESCSDKMIILIVLPTDSKSVNEIDQNISFIYLRYLQSVTCFCFCHFMTNFKYSISFHLDWKIQSLNTVLISKKSKIYQVGHNPRLVV